MPGSVLCFLLECMLLFLGKSSLQTCCNCFDFAQQTKLVPVLALESVFPHGSS